MADCCELFADGAMYRIAAAQGSATKSCKLQEVGYAKPKAGKSNLLEAHLEEGIYVLVPITGGVRPCAPDLSDPAAERAPYKPIAPQIISHCVSGALQQLVFLYDIGNGRPKRPTCTRPLALSPSRPHQSHART